MTLTLQQQIEAAQAAQRKVEELRHLEAQAAELPKLVKQKEDQEWIEGVRPVMERHKQLAAQQVVDVTDKMREWRRDFLASYALLTELINELPALQEQIHEAAKTAQRVASTRAEIDRREGKEPLIRSDPGDFAGLWAELGGNGDDICPLPSGTRERYQKWEPLIKLLATREFRLYTPERFMGEYQVMQMGE